MRARNRRLWAVGIVAILLISSATLIGFALRSTADLFFTPTKLVESGGGQPGQRAKIGGFVENGSLVFGEGTEIRFNVIDDLHTIPVVYEGTTPDLFQEGAGVVAEGTFETEGQFRARRLLAKHDENYVPRELKGVEAPGQ
ncbi:MAG: cytochrome c maturation protein CcmE [Pseudomonadota bacterium]